MQFQVTEEDSQKIDKWLQDVIFPPVIARQKEDPKYADNAIARASWEGGRPYSGAIGGGLTYRFTPTGLGTCLVVQESWSGQELNLTDYDSW